MNSIEEEQFQMMENHFNPPELKKTVVPITHDNPYICEFCNVQRYSNREGLSCPDCGHTTTNILSSAAEWRSGPSQNGEAVKMSSRVGAPHNDLYNNQMCTLMKQKGRFPSKLQRMNMRGLNSKDRCLFHAYKRFNDAQFKYQLGVTYINRAKLMYKEISEKILTRGDKRKGIMANCLLQSLKEHGILRTTSDIAEMFEIKVKDVTRTRKMFIDNVGKIIQTARPEDLMNKYITRLQLELKMKIKIIRRVNKNLEIVQKSKRLSGKTPSGIAACVIWASIKKYEISSEEQLAAICDVSTPTLVKLYLLIQDLVV